jgi:1,4-dihydroxy-2-naphthoyl-CoA hydrolase
MVKAKPVRQLNEEPVSPSCILMSTASARISSVEQLRALLPKTAPEALGVEILSVDAERLLLRMPMSDRARQPSGLLHGGISMVLAETAASLHACWDLDLSRSVPVGIEISGSHIRPAADGHILARASVVRRSFKLVVHTVEIVHEESGQVLCLSRVTNYYKEIQPVRRS